MTRKEEILNLISEGYTTKEIAERLFIGQETVRTYQEIYELAELLMQSENLEASAIILRDFAEKCYQEGAIDAQNDAAKEIREHYVEGGR